MSEKRSDFEKFKRHKDRLDDFFMKAEIGSYKNLFSILKLVLELSHGQANVERCFSVNNNVLKFSMSENSIVSRKLIIDHMNVTTFHHNLFQLQMIFSSPSALHDNVMSNILERCSNANVKMRKLTN